MKLGSEARTPHDITPITLPRPRLIMPHCRERKLLFVSATVEMQIASLARCDLGGKLEEFLLENKSDWPAAKLRAARQDFSHRGRGDCRVTFESPGLSLRLSSG
jgi:hypothetical protein